MSNVQCQQSPRENLVVDGKSPTFMARLRGERQSD